MGRKVPGDRVRGFILRMVKKNAFDIETMTARHFSVSRDLVRGHLQQLVKERKLDRLDSRRGDYYRLHLEECIFRFKIAEKDQEDIVWKETIAPRLSHLPENVLGICYYGFTEIYNNAVDHSEGSKIFVSVGRGSRRTRLLIGDDGIGIFRKIKERFNLADEREALLELSKGKLTTDPERHSGQGIFFTSRAFDKFNILSTHLMFTHDGDEESDWMIEDLEESDGTTVFMEIEDGCQRSMRQVFDRFCEDNEDYSFSKTHVPVRMARYGKDELISRSQAKRVLSRFDKFKEVMLDFQGVDFIGQAFADEIFRVFRNQHPGIKLLAVHTNDQINRMINFVQKESDAKSPPTPTAANLPSDGP